MKNILIILLTIFTTLAFSQEEGQVEEVEQVKIVKALVMLSFLPLKLHMVQDMEIYRGIWLKKQKEALMMAMIIACYTGMS